VSHPAVRVAELAVTGFRNLSNVRLHPDPHANVLLGDNGQGKTSILEAMDYAASLRSFRGAQRNHLVGREKDEAQILLRVESVGLARSYRVRLTRTAREVTLDGKRPERAVEYFGDAPCVVFQPGDLDLVRGAPELRRRLLDRILVRVVDGYGEALKTYARGLRARNALLKEKAPNAQAVQAYDFGLARYGSFIVRARNGVVAELVKAARQALTEVALAADEISVHYRPRAPDDQLAYAEALARALPGDLARRVTSVGPHGDDLALGWGGVAARTVASQGQSRALALALRLAELHVLEQRTQRVPMLLLDDVSSELDRPRTERLFHLVSRLGAQVWITTTDPNIASLLPRPRVFEVRDGGATPAVIVGKGPG
jgi:DNA replication and repair protein RecF